MYPAAWHCLRIRLLTFCALEHPSAHVVFRAPEMCYHLEIVAALLQASRVWSSSEAAMEFPFRRAIKTPWVSSNGWMVLEVLMLKSLQLVSWSGQGCAKRQNFKSTSLMPVANPFAKMTLSGPLMMANTSHDLLHSGHTGSFWQSAQSSRVAWSGFCSHRWSRLKGQAIFLTESVEWSVVQIFQKVFQDLLDMVALKGHKDGWGSKRLDKNSVISTRESETTWSTWIFAVRLRYFFWSDGGKGRSTGKLSKTDA